MFYQAYNIKMLDLSTFDTSKVTNMGWMFASDMELTILNLSSFNTSNVTNMTSMFAGCKNLTSLYLCSFNTSKVVDMLFMFANDLKLTTLRLLNFNTPNLYNAECMFRGCSKLKYLDIGNFDMSKSERVEYLVNECDALDILITAKNRKKASECKLPHTMYDRNGKAYSQLPKKVLKSPFKDVPSSHTFYKAILWAYQNGITKGYPDGTFGINRNVTRGESMMFLWRLKGKPEPMPVLKSPFSDVPKNHTFYKAILWGYQKNVTTGYTSGPKKGTFGINENCTRGQIVTFLYRAK